MQIVYIDNGLRQKIAHNAKRTETYINRNRTKSTLRFSSWGMWIAARHMAERCFVSIDYLSASRGQAASEIVAFPAGALHKGRETLKSTPIFSGPSSGPQKGNRVKTWKRFGTERFGKKKRLHPLPKETGGVFLAGLVLANLFLQRFQKTSSSFV